MKWQDVAGSVAQVGFIVSLLPSVLSEQKPAAATSFATALLLATFLVIYASYRLWVTVATTAAATMLWLVLGIQEVT